MGLYRFARHPGPATMPLIPDWAPSIHPLLVHFPITLLITAFAVDLISTWRPVSPSIRASASWLYCGGALMALAAYFSGLGAASTVLVSFDEDVAVTAHFTWAERTTWFFVFFASFRLSMSYIWHSTARWLRVASLLIALTGIGMLLATAEHGGRLVFRYGVGVAPVPASGHLWTVPGQPTDGSSQKNAR